jgi:putative heme iron utilization protein
MSRHRVLNHKATAYEISTMDQTTPASTHASTPIDSTLSERIASRLRDDPKLMTVMLARELGVPEVEVIRRLPEGRSRELDSTRVDELIHAFEPLGRVHVIVTNTATTIEAFGQFGNFSSWGDFLNVQTSNLDMHIRRSQLAHVFAVKKPSHMDGAETLSVQFFDRAGHSAFKVFLTFGGKEPSAERVEQFGKLVDEFERTRA